MSAAAPRKMTRQERNADVRQRLFGAAAAIVGERGYDEASIARITDRAGVALGTFYKHFPTRQALLDELLPMLGKEMIAFIQAQVDAIGPELEREIARFAAFFDYLHREPGFLRILNEAEFAAPEAFRRHIDNVAIPFHRILMRARDRGEVRAMSDGELEAIVHMLIGARGYLSQRYAGAGPIDGDVLSAYATLMRCGLFTDQPIATSIQPSTTRTG